MFQLVGYSKQEANRKGNAVFEVEKAITDKFIWGDESENPEKTYHKYTISNFSAATQIDWQIVLSAFKVNLRQGDSVLVEEPGYFNSIHFLINSFPPKKWAAYLQWMLIYDMAPYLNNAIRQREFIFEKILSGQQQKSQRWLWATNLVDDMLDGISGKLFVESYFTDTAIQKVTLMVDNLKSAFAERIKQLPWMTDVTKAAALEKLLAISGKIGFPEKWPDYNGLTTNPNEFAGNIKRIKKWDYESMISQLGKPVSKDDWFISLATVNAYYDRWQNAFFLPVGILQPPFFNLDADDAVNYGALGSIIGHELTHGFDKYGSKFDKDGRLFEWWNKQDAQQFNKKVDSLINLYSKLTIGSQVYVDGAMTVDENIADFGGLAIAYDAFKKTQQGKGNILIDGLTPDQRFFISYAQTWRSNVVAETAYQNALIEEHTPDMFRCNVPLSNLDAFYEAFIIQKNDAQFIPAGKRVKIW